MLDCLSRLAWRFVSWLLTFVRTGELIGALWDEFNLDRNEWIIPAARMKMGRPHVVPLARQTVSILDELLTLNATTTYVFPSVAKPGRHMSNNTILKALEASWIQRAK